MAEKIVVIGAVAAGTSAAAKARRTSEDAEIILFEKGKYISYAGCGLPYYISGTAPDREELTLMTPENFYQRNNVLVKTEHVVEEIDTRGKIVSVTDLKQNARRQVPFDRLIITTGAVPRILPIPGIDLANVFQLRTIPDADAILTCLKRSSPKHAVVLGGGLIGLEMVESFFKHGLKVTVVEKENQLLPIFDFEMAHLVETYLLEKGVTVYKGVGVKEFLGSDRGVTHAVLETGEQVPADIALVSAGVIPEVSLAKAAGIRIGTTGAIATNKRMETSVKGIYAAGDCAETSNLITGKPAWAPLGSVANWQGRTAGDNAAGGSSMFRGVLGSSIAKVLDITAGRTGLTEREARQEGYKCEVIHVHPLNRAHIYPTAEPLDIKLVVDGQSARLLGAQIVGAGGVDKRIDVIATAIKNRMTVAELTQVDFAYSPPYAPAKDPVGVAGAVAYNALTSGVRSLSPAGLKEMLDQKSDMLLVDVREPHELREDGYLEGCVNIPIDAFRSRYQELDKSRKLVLYCKQGLRGYLAGKILTHKGYENVYNLSGGLLSWPYREFLVRQHQEKGTLFAVGKGVDKEPQNDDNFRKQLRQ